MVMENRSRVDIVEKPGLILPGHYVPTVKTIDEVPKLSAEEQKAKEEEEFDPLHIKKKQERIKALEEEKTLYEKYELAKSDSYGWVQKNEHEKAKKLVREILGFEPPHVCGYQMAIAVQQNTFAHIDGRRTNIIMDYGSRDEEKYRQCTGLVVAQGPWCFRGKDFREPLWSKTARLFFNKYMEPSSYRPWCRVGDFIVFPRHAGEMLNYRGVPIIFIPDTKPYCVIERPDHVSRGF